MGRTKDVRCQCGNIIHVPLPVRLTDDGAEEITRLRHELERMQQRIYRLDQDMPALARAEKAERELEEAREKLADAWEDGFAAGECFDMAGKPPNPYAAHEAEGRGDG